MLQVHRRANMSMAVSFFLMDGEMKVSHTSRGEDCLTYQDRFRIADIFSLSSSTNNPIAKLSPMFGDEPLLSMDTLVSRT